MTPPSPESSPLPGIAGQVYHELTRAQLHDAAATKESLERRGLAVVTTSGAVLTVILGAVSLAGKHLEAPEGAILLGGLAMLAFIAAIVCGLIVNFPLGYRDPATSELRRLAETEAFWTGPVELGMRRVAGVEIDALDSARDTNGRKAIWLRTGIGIEAGAFIGLGVVGMLVLGSLIR